MEENKVLEKQKKKSKKILFLLLIVLLAIGGFCCYKFFLADDEKKNDSDKNKENPQKPDTEEVIAYHDYESCEYDSIFEENGYVFLDEVVIYDCENKGEYGCYITFVDDSEYCNTTDSLVLITDGEKDILYDYKNQKNILEVDSIRSYIYSDTGYVAYFVFEEDEKVGLASMTGKVILDAKYDDIALTTPTYDGEYSIKNNVVAVEKDGKVGVLEITTGKEVIPFEYNYVRIYNTHYILLSDTKAALVDLKLETVFEGDFDGMLLVNEVLFVEDDMELSFYDLKGNKLVEDTVKIAKPFEPNNDTGYHALSMDQYNEAITIEVYDKEGNTTACYDLNKKEKKLEKFDCDGIFEDLE